VNKMPKSTVTQPSNTLEQKTTTTSNTHHPSPLSHHNQFYNPWFPPTVPTPTPHLPNIPTRVAVQLPYPPHSSIASIHPPPLPAAYMSPHGSPLPHRRRAARYSTTDQPARQNVRRKSAEGRDRGTSRLNCSEGKGRSEVLSRWKDR
jgi:hypothetical protein